MCLGSKRLIVQELSEEGAEEMITPPWSLNELEGALPLFPEVSLARLRKLYSMWCCLSVLLDASGAAAANADSDLTSNQP